MIEATRIREAVRYLDALKVLIAFRARLESDAQSFVECRLGECSVLLSPCAIPEIMCALETEERMILNTLEIWGITATDPGPRSKEPT